MFNIGGAEVLVICMLALLVLGPDKLPDAARSAGKMYRQVRNMTDGFQHEMRNAMAEVDIQKQMEATINPTSTPTPKRVSGDVHPDAGAGPSLAPLVPADEGAPHTADAAAPDLVVDPNAPVPVDAPHGEVRTDGPDESFS